MKEEALKLADTLEKPVPVPNQPEMIYIDGHRMYAAELIRKLVEELDKQTYRADLLENSLRIIVKDKQELNAGGEPVKNATYWKRQHDKLADRIAELEKENSNLKNEISSNA